MNIDWSKAPEGATHYAPPRNGVNQLWAKRQGEYWAYHHISENKEGWYVGVQPAPAEFFIRRPNLPMPPVSEAPDGSTHWDPGSRCTATWAMKCDGIWYWHPIDGEGIENCWSPYSNVGPDPLTFIRIERTWNGEGLPPVGTVCEHKHVHEWQKVEVFAIKPNHNGRHTALFTYENGTWCGCAEPSFFRPIRTPEQIAADEHRARYMPKLIRLWDADTRREAFLEAVYEMIAEAHKP